MSMRLYLLPGNGDEDGFFLQGWVWDSETRPHPTLLPSLNVIHVHWLDTNRALVHI